MAHAKPTAGTHYLTGAATYTLKTKGDSSGAINSISINNSSTSNQVTATLFLNDGTNSINIVGPTIIPVGVTMLLDHDVSFSNFAFGLQLTLAGTSPIVSVIIK